MTKISIGAKVQVEIGGRLIPGVILFHHFASNGAYDLYMLRVAEYSHITQRWQISEYGPVQSCKLTKRRTVVPELDQGEDAKSRTFYAPSMGTATSSLKVFVMETIPVMIHSTWRYNVEPITSASHRTMSYLRTP